MFNKRYFTMATSLIGTYETINGVKYPYDPVSKMYVGWWLSGKYADRRPGTEKEYEGYMKFPKINTWDELNKRFNNNKYPDNFHGRIVYTLSPELRDDPEVLRKAIEVSHAGWSICIMSDRIQRDPEMAKMVLRDDPTNIGYLRKEHLDNYDVIKTTVEHKKYGNMIREASDRLRNDKTLARIGLSNKTCLSSFGDKIKDDEEMVELALLRDPHAWHYASERLQKKYKPWELSKKVPRPIMNVIKWTYFTVVYRIMGLDVSIGDNMYVVPCAGCNKPMVPMFRFSKPKNCYCVNCVPDGGSYSLSHTWYERNGW